MLQMHQRPMEHILSSLSQLYHTCIKFLEHRHLSLFYSALCFFTTNMRFPVSLTYPKNRIHKHSHQFHSLKAFPNQKGTWRSSSIQVQVWVNTKLWSMSLSVCFTAADCPAGQPTLKQQEKKERARDAVSLFLSSFLSGLGKSLRHMQGCADAAGGYSWLYGTGVGANS